MIVVGIAGGSGSGKSTLTERLRSVFPDMAVLYHDNYYRQHTDLTAEQLSKLNFDHPDALETDLLIDHVRQLRQGYAVECPVYDFSTHSRSSATLHVQPCRLLVIEGILLFHWEELRNLMDWKIFVDVDADIRLLRRILRDTSSRGRSLESIAKQYLESVRPMHAQFVEPTKKYADRIVHDCFDKAEWNTVKSDLERLLMP